MRPLALTALLLLSAAVCGRAQSPDAEAWGAPVEGVQLRLTSAAQTATSQVPAFEVQLRNRSGNAVTFVAEAMNSQAEVEIDGVWYGFASAGSCCTAPQTVAPGSQSRTLSLQLQNKTLFKRNANGAPVQAQFWALMPGRHSIRLRTRSAGRVNVTVQDAAPHPIVLVSNVVTFEVLTAQGVAGRPVPADLAKRALDMAKACVAKSPAAFRTVWGSSPNFDKAGLNTGSGPNLVNVFIPETTPRGKPQGLALEVHTQTGACIDFTNKLE
jgi:hypothetical protein